MSEDSSLAEALAETRHSGSPAGGMRFYLGLGGMSRMGLGSNSGRVSSNQSRFQLSLYHRAAMGTHSRKGGLIRAGGLHPGREICQSGQVRQLISTAREPLLIEASGIGERACASPQ